MRILALITALFSTLPQLAELNFNALEGCVGWIALAIGLGVLAKVTPK